MRWFWEYRDENIRLKEQLKEQEELIREFAEYKRHSPHGASLLRNMLDGLYPDKKMLDITNDL